ncbi:zinc finger MYM-type protein 1-like [Pyrus x bretschneideri]|uniref:zinc finger MYM-type protein 1-like n=1 Tax=Pyrus x bretschneideri TaxID=225117 RepID=UPI00202DD222|nr:zinc finger MYM-type protein 1-like [Pyrus x bretschneideri]
MGLLYSEKPINDQNLLGYVGVGFLIDPHKTHSQTGYEFIYGNTAISCDKLVDLFTISLLKCTFQKLVHGSDAFTGVGFKKWKNARECFDKHVGPIGNVHNKAREAASYLMNQKTHLEAVVIKQSEEKCMKYHRCMNASIDCTKFLLRQGLPFRGHYESDTLNNRGNYLELLQFLADHDEKIKEVVLENVPGNLKLIASSIQKDIVNSCAYETIKAIMKEVKESKCFSIIVDESRDVSTKEQMAMVLRYVDNKGQVIERFMGVQHVIETTSSKLKEFIDEFLKLHDLSYSNLRGQGYDGASNMRALVAVAKKNFDVATFFTLTNSLVNVVGCSCKRYDALREKQQENLMKAIENECLEMGQGLNQETSLKRAGDTQWNSHYGALISLIIMFSSMVDVLDMIVEDATMIVLVKQKAFVKEKLVHLAQLYPKEFMDRDRSALQDQPDIYIHFLALVLLVATASVDRAFSDMNIIKGQLRNKMENQWLSDSLVVYIKKNVFSCIGNEAIIEHFQTMKPCRGRLN